MASTTNSLSFESARLSNLPLSFQIVDLPIIPVNCFITKGAAAVTCASWRKGSFQFLLSSLFFSLSIT